MILHHNPLQSGRVALALVLAASAGCATVHPRPSPAAGAELNLEGEEAETLRAYVYFDMDLDAVVYHLPAEGDLGRAIQLLKDGKPAQAKAALTPAALASGVPLARMTDALIKRESGDADGSKEVLRGVLRDERLPVCFRLWAAHALRSAGEKIEGEKMDFPLGVVAEGTMVQGTDVLGVYADGMVWYVNQSGNARLYSAKDGLVTRQVGAVGPTVPRQFPGAVRVSDQERPPLDQDEFRITILTLSGPRRVRQSVKALGGGTPYDQLYLRLQDVFVRLVELEIEKEAQGG